MDVLNARASGPLPLKKRMRRRQVAIDFDQWLEMRLNQIDTVECSHAAAVKALEAGNNVVVFEAPLSEACRADVLLGIRNTSDVNDATCTINVNTDSLCKHDQSEACSARTITTRIEPGGTVAPVDECYPLPLIYYRDSVRFKSLEMSNLVGLFCVFSDSMLDILVRASPWMGGICWMANDGGTVAFPDLRLWLQKLSV